MDQLSGYSGKFNLRTPKTLHAKLARQANRDFNRLQLAGEE